MDMNQSAMFLAGALLIGIGSIVIAAVVLVINNLFAKFWKPITWQIYNPHSYPTTVDTDADNVVQFNNQDKSVEDQNARVMGRKVSTKDSK